MRAVAVTCVKNEVDIVEAFVRHTLAYVDHIVVLDNGSKDGTCDVLRAMEKEGLSLDVVEDPSPGKYQAQRMTRLMHEWAIGRYDADWVLALDGDEFLAIPQGSPLVPDGFNGDRPVSIPWRTYVPDDEDDAFQPNPVLRIRRRCAADQWELAKVMVPRSLAALPTCEPRPRKPRNPCGWSALRTVFSWQRASRTFSDTQPRTICGKNCDQLASIPSNGEPPLRGSVSLQGAVRSVEAKSGRLHRQSFKDSPTLFSAAWKRGSSQGLFSILCLIAAARSGTHPALLTHRWRGMHFCPMLKISPVNTRSLLPV